MKRTGSIKIVMYGLVAALLGMAFIACGTAPVRPEGEIVSVLATGEWLPVTDAEDGGSSTNEMTEVEIDGAPAWHFAGEVTTQFQWGFAIMQLDPDEATLANLGGMDAISFMVLGDGQRYTIRLQSSNVTDHGYFEFAFDTVAGEASRITVPLNLFMQPPWATSVGRFRQDLVTTISWQTHESWRPGTFELTLWDVRLDVPESVVVLAQAPVEVLEVVEVVEEEVGYNE
ncbi:MAG: CIA30 family protein [Treponema sp.]|nr:CIA30 family protein [Treponema sp.]